MNYDVAVVGAGVIGSLIARDLSRYNIKIALIEKCNDMAMGTSKSQQRYRSRRFSTRSPAPSKHAST